MILDINSGYNTVNVDIIEQPTDLPANIILFDVFDVFIVFIVLVFLNIISCSNGIISFLASLLFLISNI